MNQCPYISPYKFSRRNKFGDYTVSCQLERGHTGAHEEAGCMPNPVGDWFLEKGDEMNCTENVVDSYTKALAFDEIAALVIADLGVHPRDPWKPESIVAAVRGYLARQGDIQVDAKIKEARGQVTAALSREYEARLDVLREEIVRLKTQVTSDVTPPRVVSMSQFLTEYGEYLEGKRDYADLPVLARAK